MEPLTARHLVPLVSGLLCLMSCRDAERGMEPAYQGRDSLGIEIVTVYRPAWSDGEGWQVRQAPLLEIGHAGGSAAYEFSRVRDAHRLADGSFVVGEGIVPEVRVFATDGTFLRAMGQRGGGPGEFEFLMNVRVSGDTILTYDFLQSRVTLFGVDGTHLGDVRLEVEEGRPRDLYRFGGGFLGVIVGISDARTEEFALSRLPVVLRAFDPDGRAGPILAELSGEEYFQRASPQAGGVIAFITQPIMAHGARHTMVGSRLVAGSTDHFELRIFQPDRGLERIIRVPHRDRAVDPVEWNAALAERLADADTPEHRATAREIVDLSPVPDTRPAYGRFVPDSEGYVWVEPYRPAEGPTVPWLVVDLDGDILGDVHLPTGFQPTQVGTDYVLGIVRDEFDVPYVRMYALDRTTGGDRGPWTSRDNG